MHPDDVSHEEPTYVPDSPTRTSGWAVTSSVLGVAALMLVATPLASFAALVAVICGHAARREIKAGLRYGSNYAVLGLGLGYLVLVLVIATRIATA